MSKEDWKWYYSADEERYNGPCATREEAIAEGRRELEEDFNILEATRGEYDLSLDGNLFEMLDGQNEDNVDPGGDGFSAQLSNEEADDLLKSVNAAIEAWKLRTPLPAAWSFGKIRNKEQIKNNH